MKIFMTFENTPITLFLRKMKKAPLLLFTFLFLLSCVDEKTSPEMESLHQRIDSLTTALEQEKQLRDSLQMTIKEVDSVKGGYPLFFGKKYEGIEDPEGFIKNQLQNQPDKIPLSPVLGGNMEFRKIDIISEKWLLAIYDDGHVQGKAIMQYELQPDGSVKYTVVATQE